MIFNNKLKITKEKKKSIYIATKKVVFILIFLGLTSSAILQKMQLKSKQNYNHKYNSAIKNLKRRFKKLTPIFYA